MANTALKVSELDFFSIKNNLKDFLRNQDTFTDYDFEGSGMAVLLDVLAYNTYYNSYYLNMVANEAFLDTAQSRPNMLSHAKAIGYVPNSKRGSLSQVTIQVTPSTTEDNNLNVLTLDRYTRFLGKDINGINHPFVTINANTAYKAGNSFVFPNVYIKQGEVTTLQFQANTNNINRRFELPSQNVDTTTLVVTVQDSITNTVRTQYTQFTDVTDIHANSKVYFVEENANENYTIYFGDDIIGKKPANGNIITVTYLDVAGSVANNVSDFRFSSPIGGLYRDNVRISVVKTSYGGTDKETVEETRFRAPYAYNTQNRAVTRMDYETLVMKDYTNIESVSVWGGEENDPPVYGKVYLSLKTRGYYKLTEIEKEEIKNSLLNTRNVLTVIPEVVEPDYNYLLLNGYVTYDPSLTDLTANQLLTKVREAIRDYVNTDLNTFRSTFRKSKMLRYIDECDPSITASDISIYLQKKVELEIGASRNYELKYNTPIDRYSIDKKIYSFPQIYLNDINRITQQVYFEEVPSSVTGIDSISILNPGLDYTAKPTVTITGDGSGATAEAVVVNGKVKSIKVLTRGVNYTRATASITGGNGSGATAAVKVQNNLGTLRTFYYRSNGEKVIVNDTAGTVDYNRGSITLTNLLPLRVPTNSFYAANTVAIMAVPREDIIEPVRNKIITVDFNNPQSIQIEMIAKP